MKIGVIGCGVVGEAHAKLCEAFGHRVFRNDRVPKDADNYYGKSDLKKHCEMIFLCLPTPSTSNGISMKVFDEVMSGLEGFKGLVVIKSTVLPTTCDSYSALYNLRIAHNPEFLTEANAVVDAMQPDKIIIGRKEEDKELVDMLIDLYSPFIKKGVEVFITNTVTSELSKYASNCFLAMKVSFANEWFDICKQWKHVDYDVIKNSLYADKRIGDTHLDVKQTRYWNGHCFPKDTVAMHNMCKLLNIDDKMLHATIMKNTTYFGSVGTWWDKDGKQLI